MTTRLDERRLQTVADGLQFTECPRWHDGQLWFSDMPSGRVLRLHEDGRLEEVLRLVDDAAGGLGFLPGGDLLVVGMRRARLHRFGAGGLQLHADLAPLARWGINDLVVDRRGRAYVVQFGYDHHGDAPPQPSPLLSVAPDGRASIATPDGSDGHAAAGLLVGNGMVIDERRGLLVCAESGGGRLTAFPIDAHTGGLGPGRLFAQLPPGHFPDGICLDQDGGIWVACCTGPGVVRVEDGGRVTHSLSLGDGRYAYACMFGGPRRDRLYVCTAGAYRRGAVVQDRSSRIEVIETSFVGAGLP